MVAILWFCGIRSPAISEQDRRDAAFPKGLTPGCGTVTFRAAIWNDDRSHHAPSLPMNDPGSPVNFDLVYENARQQGVPLEEIAICYSDLTPAEKAAMKDEGLITHDSGHGTVIARFRPDGQPSFPEKATSVHYLATD